MRVAEFSHVVDWSHRFWLWVSGLVGRWASLWKYLNDMFSYPYRGYATARFARSAPLAATAVLISRSYSHSYNNLCWSDWKILNLTPMPLLLRMPTNLPILASICNFSEYYPDAKEKNATSQATTTLMHVWRTRSPKNVNHLQFLPVVNNSSLKMEFPNEQPM